MAQKNFYFLLSVESTTLWAFDKAQSSEYVPELDVISP